MLPTFHTTDFFESPQPELSILKLDPWVMPEDVQKQALKLENLVSGNIVVNLKRRIITPLSFLRPTLGVMFQPAMDTSLRIPSDSGNTNIDNAKLLASCRFLLVQNVYATSNVRYQFCTIPFSEQQTSLDKTQL
ncbi:MAG TPA: hypothetical protein VL171_17770 [Verrucomicrobiae bacterium]|nr:hypothetical protein [Verrucomicrobiae bacterium]